MGPYLRRRIWITPFIQKFGWSSNPYMNVLGVEERIIGASVNKPEQFSQTRFPSHFFVVSIGILPFSN
jgi:hypothetical protein